MSWSFLGKTSSLLSCLPVPHPSLELPDFLGETRQGLWSQAYNAGICHPTRLTSFPLSPSALAHLNLLKPHNFTVSTLWDGLLPVLMQGPPWPSLGLCRPSSPAYHDNSLLWVSKQQGASCHWSYSLATLCLAKPSQPQDQGLKAEASSQNKEGNPAT